jgi:hypothetical protein
MGDSAAAYFGMAAVVLLAVFAASFYEQQAAGRTASTLSLIRYILNDLIYVGFFYLNAIVLIPADQHKAEDGKK